MGFKDLPGGQNDRDKKGLADFAPELSPKTKAPPKNR